MLSDPALGTWFTAVAIGIGALLFFLLAAHWVTEWRRLRAAGASRAGAIVRKQLAGIVLGLAGLRRGDATRSADLTGASVWLEWDQRWGGHGACMGRVLRQEQGEPHTQLLIETAAPQALPTGSTSTVWFAPRSSRELQMHRVAVVRGTLRANHAPNVVDCRLTSQGDMLRTDSR